jgi:hypothetical protein
MATPCYGKIVYGPTADGSPLNKDTNVELPYSTKSRLLSKVVYADDEVTPMYIEHTLTVECIIYNEIITSTNAANDVELEAKRIRDILKTPGYKLKIYPVGLGTFGIINSTVPDVKGGPFPQEVEVTGYASNNAISIRWSVMFRTVDCISSYTNLNVLQYNIEQDFDVDDDGNLQFTVNITYQTRNPILDTQPIQDISNMLVRRINRSFQGMRKKKRTSFSRDMRIMSVKLTYSDIHSDNAFFRHTSDISITDDLESTLYQTGGTYGTGGFYKWKRSIGGTIKLPPRIHKGYAWAIFLKILESRFTDLRLSVKLPGANLTSRPAGQPENPEVQTKGWFLPLRIKITEPIYSRQISMQVDYLVTCSIDNIFSATRMFQRVNTLWDGASEASDPLPLSDQWEDWQTNRDHNTMGYFQYNLSGIPIVFSQCNNTKTVPQFGANIERPLEDDPDLDNSSTEGEGESAKFGILPDKEPIAANYSWIKYENEFELIEETNNIPVTYLEEPNVEYYQHTSSQGEYVNRAASGMVVNGSITNSPQSYPSTVIDRGASQNLIRMKGHAIRAGFKIPIPFITTVAGKTVKRTGTPRMSQKEIGTGDTPVYLAMWDITYAVVGGDVNSTDLLNSIISTGSPAHYA